MENNLPKKRIYPEINAEPRTTVSFADQATPGHHLTGPSSPLLIEVIEGVVLDYMHLLCVGVMKNIVDKWITSRNPCRLSVSKKLELKTVLLTLSTRVPSEFQRKMFDFDDLGNWKATQYRFVLLYLGHLLAEHILPDTQNKHYLLLFTACRILCHEKLAKKNEYIDLAETYLKNFFCLLPTFYGKDSQVMNYHNLIHLTNDVSYMGASLASFSGFPFENSLAYIKKLVRTPVEPLAQVSRRFAELETGADVLARPHALFSVDIDTSKTIALKKKSAAHYDY